MAEQLQRAVEALKDEKLRERFAKEHAEVEAELLDAEHAEAKPAPSEST